MPSTPDQEPPIRPKRKHRATGRPRGRTKTRPDNFDEVILAALRRRMDPISRKVVPHWRILLEEFHMGRNTLGAAIRSLKSKGLLTSISDPTILGTDRRSRVYLLA